MMRTYFLLAACAASLLSAEVSKAGTVPVLDQNFFLNDWPFDGLAGSGHPSSPTIIQTFTVGITGNLSSVALPLTNLRVPSVVTLAIYRISGGLPISGPLGTASVEALSLPDDPSPIFTQTPLAKFDYSSQAIPVMAGEQIAMRLSAPQPRLNEDGVAYYGNKGYTGGNLFIDIGSGPVSNFPYSMFLQTYVEPTAVPEPAPGALLGTCFLCLFLLHWRSRHKRRVF